MPDITKKFMNIWEIESHFKCPLVGAVLTVEKHKAILKKCGYKVAELKPYEYHQTIMSKLHEKNEVSVKVNNFIRSRARKWMDMVDGMSDGQMRSLWKKNLESGQVGPLMYAIVSHEDTCIGLLHDVYGEVHMKAHANMTGIFQVRQKLVKTETAMDREKKKLQLKNQAESLEHSLSPERYQETAMLEQELTAVKSALGSQYQILCTKESEYKTLWNKYLNVRDEKKIIQQEIEMFISAFGAAPPPCQTDANCLKEACSQYQLCARRIFMIGGITKMKAHYKDIIEKAGGKFDYHDGYLKSAGSDIEAKVKRSDLVLCPVKHNSHNACIRVKKLCNRHKTPLKILSSSSLTAISQAVFSPEKTITIN